MDIRNYIDYSILDPKLTSNEVEAALIRAKMMNIHSVCVLPSSVGIAHSERKSNHQLMRICTVIDFPYGSNQTIVRAAEAAAYADLCDELDIVARIDYIRDCNWIGLTDDLTKVIAAAREIKRGLTIKVIIETGLLKSDADKMKAAACVYASDADFVKTSTGVLADGAEVDDIILLSTFKPLLQVKASGGIRSGFIAKKMIEAGAGRLGIGYTNVSTVLKECDEL